MDIFTEKQTVRGEAKRKVACLSPAQKGLESAMKCAAFIRSNAFREAKIIFSFMPMKDELDILPILRCALENDKKVLIPRIRPSSNDMDFYFVESDFYKETEKSSFGMYEPLSCQSPVNLKGVSEKYAAAGTLVFVPGLAFGRDGSRLGRGKGFYDKFLREFSSLFAAEEKPLYRGVCYDIQIFDSVPCSEGDVFMDCLL